jgi:hypothetical protein
MATSPAIGRIHSQKAWAFTVQVVHVFRCAGDRHGRDRGSAPARVASTKRPFAGLAADWAAFVIAVIAGLLLFISRATGI